MDADDVFEIDSSSHDQLMKNEGHVFVCGACYAAVSYFLRLFQE